MKRLLLVIIILFSTSSLFAQFDNVYGARKNELMYNEAARNIQFRKAGETVLYDSDAVEGTPFIYNTFKKGTIILHNDSSINIPLNYNAFIDAFEFIKDSTRFIVTNNFSVKKIIVNGKSFYYKLYIDSDNNEKFGYFHLVVDGKNKLYIKYKVDFKEPEPAETPLHLDKPARFSEVSKMYYLEYNDNLVLFNNNNTRNSLNNFNNCKDTIKIFIKENDLSFKKENDLIQIIEYYNTISCK